jgi:hypothetical protein
LPEEEDDSLASDLDVSKFDFDTRQKKAEEEKQKVNLLPVACLMSVHRGHESVGIDVCLPHH